MVRSDFHAAWARCLSVWRCNNGADDWRGVYGRPYYAPSFARRLARSFAIRHHKNVDKLLEKSAANDEIEAITAIDVLVQIGELFSQTRIPIMSSTLKLTEDVSEILEQDAADLASVLNEPCQTFDTVGEYFTWEFSVEPDASTDEGLSG